MYNRYIPQSDGSFRRNRIPETTAKPSRPQPTPQKQPPCPAPMMPVRPVSPERKPQPHKQPQTAEGFLRHLLPQGLDTGDLLIGVLLLLMAGDCQEDKNTALLTLALYLFL